MRPRVFPAEDVRRDRGAGDRPHASMRPRVFPAEDARAIGDPAVVAQGFNEAAGIPRGRRVAPRVAPRVPARFNEAAGIPRGRQAIDAQIEAVGKQLQ